MPTEVRTLFDDCFRENMLPSTHRIALDALRFSGDDTVRLHSQRSIRAEYAYHGTFLARPNPGVGA